MIKKTVTIINQSGLHARPASEFVSAAAGFKSDVTIRNVAEAGAVNAKSIVMVLALGLNKGVTVEIAASGSDEKEAAKALAALIEGGFGE